MDPASPPRLDPRVTRALLGDEPLDSDEIKALIAADPDAQRVAAELDRVQAAVRDLPVAPRSPELDRLVLDRVSRFPQGEKARPMRDMALGDPSPVPKPANPMRKAWPWLAGFGIAAAALIGLRFVPVSWTSQDPPQKGELVQKGVQEPTAPEVGLRMSVQKGEKTTRFKRGRMLADGDTLFFRADSSAAGHVYLVRVDQDGAEVLTDQDVSGGTADLRAGEGLFGYDVEAGESEAIFAVIQGTKPIPVNDLEKALSVGPDAAKVCAAAAELDARCDAEKVEVAP
jgi:hypothetical protein